MFRCTGSSDDRIWIPPVLGKYCLPSFFFHFFSPFPSSALSSLLPSLSFLLPHYTYSPRNTRRCLYSAPHWIHHVLALAKLQVKTFILHINEEWSSSRDAWRREIQNLSTGTVEGWKRKNRLECFGAIAYISRVTKDRTTESIAGRVEFSPDWLVWIPPGLPKVLLEYEDWF